MKRVLSIIFGLVLVGCLTGCQSTKVETPVVEAPVEERVHPETQRLEIKGLSKTGIVEIGLNEKWELDVVDKDASIRVFYDDGDSYGFGISKDLVKKVEIEYYGWEDDEIIRITEYLNKSFGEGTIQWYKENCVGKRCFYEEKDNEDSKFYNYAFMRTYSDPDYRYLVVDKKREAFLESIRDAMYGD